MTGFLQQAAGDRVIIELMSEGERYGAMRYRDFRLFWLGQVISFTGTWMHSTAQGWLIYSLTRSPYYLGLVAASASLPVLALSLFGGVAADRFPKRNLLLLTQGLAILPAIFIGVLTSLGAVEVWHVICFALFLGTLNAFDIPARQSFLVEMVQRGNLMNAIALNSAAFNGARMLGPMIAGLTISYIGIAGCFYLNAVSFLPVIFALAMMRTRGEPRPSEGRSVLSEISEGIRFMRREPMIWRTMLLVSAMSLFGLPFVTLLPVMAEEVLGVGARGFGFMAASLGAGAFLAAVGLVLRGEIKDTWRLMSAASLMFPVLLFMFASSTEYQLSIPVLFLGGIVVVGMMALANTTIQMHTPDGMRGRIMSVFTLLFLGVSPIGNLMMGSIADIIGTVNALKLASVICLALSFITAYGARKR